MGDTDIILRNTLKAFSGGSLDYYIKCSCIASCTSSQLGISRVTTSTYGLYMYVLYMHDTFEVGSGLFFPQVRYLPAIL